MNFENLKIKEITQIIRYVPDTTKFSSVNKNENIVGIQISGNALHCFADKKITLKSSCIYFFNQYEDYSVNVNEVGQAFSVHFTTYEPIKTPSFSNHTDNPNVIINTLEKAEREFFGNNFLSLSEIFYRLCSQINKIRTSENNLKDVRIASAEKYMCEHFRERNCFSDAICASGLSSRRFNDLFKEYFLETPNNYLINLKISYAKKILASKFISVNQTSELCGFEDVSYFSKVFKKITGVSPSDYRKNISE